MAKKRAEMAGLKAGAKPKGHRHRSRDPVKGEPKADEHQSETVPVVNVQVVGEDIGVPAAFSIPLTTT
jgi:hypothetical protein